MSAARRAAVHNLATAAYGIGLDVATGVVEKDENGRWRIGSHDVEAWLIAHQGQEIVLAMGSLSDERPLDYRTCRTCGRDYADIDCPHCRANRLRLRGR